MYRLKSRTIALALTCVLMVFMTGSLALAQQKTITFLTPPWGVPPNADALAAFQEEAGFQVDIQSVQMEDLFSRIQVAAATNRSAADVIFLTEEAPSNVVATGNMLPLNDLVENTPELDLSDFMVVDFWSQDDQIYGIPVYVQLVMMDYNVATLAEAGFAEPPATWEELRDMAAAIKEQGIDPHPIAFGAIDWSWYLMALSMGDPMFDEDLNPVFADADSHARAAMEMLLGFFNDELISPEILAGSVTQHNLFWSGTGVFHQAWQGSVRVANNPDVSQQAPNVEYLLLPDEHYTWSFPAAIGISANSQNVDEAWEFIQWYVGNQNQTDIYNAFGLVPSRISVQGELDEADLIQGFDVIQEQTMYVNELPRYTLWWGPFTEFVSQMVLRAAQTGMSADEVIDRLADEWNMLKEEYQ